MVRELADDAQNASEEALHRVVLEEHVARPQLCEDTSERPQIDLLVVRQPQHHLRRAVGARLHVGGEVVVDEAARTEVDNLHLTTAVRPDQDVLGLEVAMDEPQGVHVIQSGEHLLRDLLEAAEREVGLVPALPVELRELVQVVPQQLRNNDQVLLVVEVVVEAEDAVLVNIAVYIDVLQQLDFIQRLVEEVLVVLDDLHANHLVALEVQALHRPGKGGRAQVFEDLVASCHDGVHADGELLGLFEAGLVPLEDDAEAKGVEDDAVELHRVETVARRRILHVPAVLLPRVPRGRLALILRRNGKLLGRCSILSRSAALGSLFAASL
mmetsp:Transcript_55807/g.155600  ORF Transcript_55807/g.155600 Transcript_55807/m.155600 type:complete len:326 (-) Transcript_55807:1149-2126(-)